jgi:hypothetical protein
MACYPVPSDSVFFTIVVDPEIFILDPDLGITDTDPDPGG